MSKTFRKTSAKGNSLCNDDRNPPLLLNMTKSFRALVVTDLDGTLINDEGKLSETDRATLTMLGQKGVLRVVATGRNYYSAAKVIQQDFPIDYLVVSSGSAILSWPDQTLCAAHHLDRSQVELIANSLREKKLDFMLHAAYPNSHYLYFSKNNSDPNPDFYARIKYYKDYVSEWNSTIVPDGDAFTQFLVVEPAEHPSYLESLKSAFDGVKVIQATSPYDHNSRWLEIYSSRVDKGQAAEWVASRHDLTADLTLATGNDTNDIDMLDWAGKSFVVANVTPSIKNKYTNLQCSNNKSAFSEAVSLWMKDIQWE